jgi:predicted nucleotidyltransferase
MGQATVDVRGVVKQLVRALKHKVHVDRVILFGSRARSDAREFSDVDLLVISPDFGRDILADYALLNGSLGLIDIDVDIDLIPRTPDQVAHAEPDSFLATILEDGVVVYPPGQ